MPDGLRSPCVFPPGWWLPQAQARARSSPCFHVSNVPRPAGERLLCGSARTFRQTRSVSGDTEAARQRLPRTCALECVLVCYPQAGLPTFPVPLVPGTRGKQICWIQIGGQKRGVQVTLDGSDATGARVPALPQRFLHMLSATMTELGEVGAAGGDFHQ